MIDEAHSFGVLGRGRRIPRRPRPLASALGHGILAGPIIYPAVPESAARVRFFLGAAHTTEQVDETIDAVGTALAALSGADRARPKAAPPAWITAGYLMLEEVATRVV